MKVSAFFCKETYSYAFDLFRLFPLVGLLLVFIDAPHGKFSPGENLKGPSIFKQNLSVDGTLAWILMELPSPITFLYAYNIAPLWPLVSRWQGTKSLASTSVKLLAGDPSTILAALFLLHYLNRSLISPLRTPTRARSHIIVPVAAIVFNVLNGSLLGAFLSSGRLTQANPESNHTWFWIGVCVFALGMTGNVVHDEILLSLRKDRSGGNANGTQTPRYAIPYGYLYQWISYPNYFCEWIEWVGFALATSAASGNYSVWDNPAWWFVICEVTLMGPRALRGHQWYHEKFEDYPKDRKAVIPYLL